MHVVPWFWAWILSKIPLLNFYSIIDLLTLMTTFQLILTQRFVHWTISNSIIKWFLLSEMEAASFLVKVEALDKRGIQLNLRNDETPNRRWENNVVSWSEMGKLFDALTAMSNLRRARKEVTYCNRPKRFYERITGGHARIKRGQKNSY